MTVIGEAKRNLQGRELSLERGEKFRWWGGGGGLGWTEICLSTKEKVREEKERIPWGFIRQKETHLSQQQGGGEMKGNVHKRLESGLGKGAELLIIRGSIKSS